MGRRVGRWQNSEKKSMGNNKEKKKVETVVRQWQRAEKKKEQEKYEKRSDEKIIKKEKQKRI